MRYRLFLLFCIYAFSASADICTTTKSGNFNAKTVWDCGKVPESGDTAIVASGHTLTVNVNVDLSDFRLEVYGTLDFNNNKEFSIGSNSNIQAWSGGLITGGNVSTHIIVASATVWTGGGDDVVGAAFVSSGMSSFSTGVLPIELLYFHAAAKDNVVVVNWETAKEINNDYYTIERSINGLDFITVGTLKGAGTINKNRSYEFEDHAPVEGTSYYRLKQTDYDGRYEYFDMVSVDYELEEENTCILHVYPNPCMGKCSVNLKDCNLEEHPEIKVSLVDALGNQVYSKVPYRESGGNFSFSVDTQNNLKPGVYIVSGVSKKEKYTKKIIVK